jgi:hypothetical protein
VFAYLACHHNVILVFYPTYPGIDMGDFKTFDFEPMYWGVFIDLPNYPALL